MKPITKYSLGDMQDDILNINGAISVLAMISDTEGLTPIIGNALDFVINSLNIYSDHLSLAIDELIDMEVAHV